MLVRQADNKLIGSQVWGTLSAYLVNSQLRAARPAHVHKDNKPQQPPWDSKHHQRRNHYVAARRQLYEIIIWLTFGLKLQHCQPEHQ